MIGPTFTIKEGKHYSTPIKFKLHPARTIVTYNAKFYPDCWYEYVNHDSWDKNKLCGMSFGYHHWNSIRVGWIPNFKDKGKISLYAYWYNNRERHNSLYICDVDVNDYFRVFIDVLEKSYFSIQISSTYETSEIEVPFDLPKCLFGYYLWPYFGGNNLAPHEMEIYLRLCK